LERQQTLLVDHIATLREAVAAAGFAVIKVTQFVIEPALAYDPKRPSIFRLFLNI
jgi:hypothetical protein